MRIASKLTGAFALYIVLLAGVLVYHVGTVQRSVVRGRELTAIADRYRVITNDQLGRVADMSLHAEKYLVTRDRGYLDRFGELAAAFGDELRRLQSLSLSGDERDRLGVLGDHWRVVEVEARRLLRDSSTAVASESLARLEPILDQAIIETQQLGAAAQAALTLELAQSERAAVTAEGIAWAAAAAALLLSVLLSVLLVRSIVRPLERLAKGTREISAGRLDFRLDGSGSDELAQVALEFNRMSARLQELDRLKRDFVSNVSHDLKTPLSSMQETTEALLDELPGPLAQKQRHLLELSRESGRRLSAMIAKLLDLSRLESLRPRTAEVFDVARLAGRVVERFNETRQGRGPRITFDAAVSTMLVRGDGDGFTQVIDNLLENAIKFSPTDGLIRVSAQVRDGSAVVRVCDEGPGIPDKDKERVFERFYQTDAGRSVQSRGAGLGLAICRQIVALHGGRISVSDNHPRGSVFSVVLPMVAVRAEAA